MQAGADGDVERIVKDRAGLVGADGPTHAGSYDVAYLGCLPDFVIMAAADEAEEGANDVTEGASCPPTRCGGGG